MNPEKQRIAIAQACGWKRCIHVTDFRDGCNGENPRGIFTVLPDYLNDLNAMHEAEKLLANDQCAAYLVILARSLPEAGLDSWAFHATASQRAEAFLKTLGLWTND
jgi:hypothetical protein